LFFVLYIGQHENFYEGKISELSDIDYKVYLDASLYDSPYDRHTYRYSPLLSLIMSPSYKYYQGFGKILLVIFDFIATYFAYHIFYKPDDKQKIFYARLIAILYSWNPIFFYITFRGSCESITISLMFAFWYFFTDTDNFNKSAD
jgi:phosphatidylinositol glycan class M